MTAASLATFCRVLLGLVFLTSVVFKLKDYPGFLKTIRSFKLVSERWVGLSGAVVLAWEGGSIVLLAMGGNLLAAGFIASGGLVLVLSLVLYSVLRRELAVACNCFGKAESPVSASSIIRNGILVAFAFIGLAAAGSASTFSTTDLLFIPPAIAASILIMSFEDLAAVLKTSKSPT